MTCGARGTVGGAPYDRTKIRSAEVLIDATSALAAEELSRVTVRVASGGLPDDDAALVEVIREAEMAKCALESLQARASAELDRLQRERAAAAGEPRSQQGRGVESQVALARRESPHRGRQLLGLAKVLHELPCTASAFRQGLVSEYRVMLVARETAWLSLEHRQYVDERLAGDPIALEGLGSRQIVAEVRTLAAKLDPKAVAKRRKRAEGERCVTLRPAPDSMTWLTALLPVAQGVAVKAALDSTADRRRSAGDDRSRGQLQADTLVEAVLGAARSERGWQTGWDAAPPEPGPAFTANPIHLRLLVTDRALFEQADDTAYLPGHGPIPVDLARELLAAALDSQSQAGKAMVWLKRLYTDPTTGELVQMDSRSRVFEGAVGEFLDLRDQWCRNAWCDARIRHRDHVTGYQGTGTTSAEDGQGLCEACNYAKQGIGWSARPIRGPDGEHVVETTTPTGHVYRSRAPSLVEPEPPPGDLSRAG